MLLDDHTADSCMDGERVAVHDGYLPLQIDRVLRNHRLS